MRPTCRVASRALQSAHRPAVLQVRKFAFALPSGPVADLTPEVMSALVRLMNGEVDLDSMTDDELFALASAAIDGRDLLHRVVVLLNGRGHTFAQIGERLDVVESTASRWAKPPVPRGRPRRPRDSNDEA